ncbi:hypothetical protein VAR608DRAFT_6145 [Variovorax sp. HW608]|nr:hypothetical protein VAR608DRAFT_6145 [Variovorax sp. HW608]
MLALGRQWRDLSWFSCCSETKTYYRVNTGRGSPAARAVRELRPLDSNLHSLSRQLIELRIEHADLDASIDRLADAVSRDELLLRRLKKRRLALRDEIARLERLLDPQEPA